MRQPLVAAKPLLDRINVTPIIDVALVLVIILLVTAPMLAVADIDVDLPGARSRGEEDQPDICVTVGASGEIAVDEAILSPGESLAAALAGRLPAEDREDRLVVVRADAELDHAAVRGIIDDLRRGGAVRIAVAVRQSGGDSR